MTIKPKLWLALGSAYGFLGVSFGAFAAHGLRGRLGEAMMVIFRTAVDYQFYHAFALLIVGVLSVQRPSKPLDASGICFATGVLFFSGSLYALSLTGMKNFGAITPIGGLLFLAGWALLGLSVSRLKD